MSVMEEAGTTFRVSEGVFYQANHALDRDATLAVVQCYAEQYCPGLSDVVCMSAL